MKRKITNQQIVLFSSGKTISVWQYQTSKEIRLLKNNSIDLEEGACELPGQSLIENLEKLLKPIGATNKDVSLVLGSENVFSFRLEIPDMDKEDVASFLELEAEQHLPYSPTDFYITPATQDKKNIGDTLILAIQKSKINPFTTALKSIGFNLLSVSINIAGSLGLESQDSNYESLLLQSGDHYTFAMHGGGKLLGLRQFPHPNSPAEIQSMIRDIRITIAQTPADIQGALRKIQFLALPNATLEQEKLLLGEFGQATGLSLSKSHHSERLFLSIADAVSKKNQAQIEFLPPKPNKFEKIVQRFNSRRTFWIGAGATAAIVLIGLSFYLQSQQLNSLQSKWEKIESKVGELEKIQGQIREFRPWFKSDIPTLQALKATFETFPETGNIWLKQVTIKNGTAIRCGGSAVDLNAVLAVREELMKTPGVVDLRELASGGGSPMTFSFQFNWNPQAAAAGTVITPSLTTSEEIQNQGIDDAN